MDQGQINRKQEVLFVQKSVQKNLRPSSKLAVRIKIPLKFTAHNAALVGWPHLP